MEAQDIKNIIYEELQIPQELKLGRIEIYLCDLEKIVDKISIRVEKLVSPTERNSFGQWISVKDRLPERGESVLTYDPTDTDEPFCVNNLYQAMDKKLRWDFGQEGITHWMPIKEIPLPKL